MKRLTWTPRPILRAERSKARQAILDAANAHRVTVNPNVVPWGRRHIDQAVCVARRNRLVAPKVLVTAGFRATGER